MELEERVIPEQELVKLYHVTEGGTYLIFDLATWHYGDSWRNDHGIYSSRESACAKLEEIVKSKDRYSVLRRTSFHIALHRVEEDASVDCYAIEVEKKELAFDGNGGVWYKGQKVIA